MEVKIVKYAINKKIFPPFRQLSPRFLKGEMSVLKKGFYPNDREKIQSEYPNIEQPERPE